MSRGRGILGGLFRRSPSTVLAEAERLIAADDAAAGAALLRPMAEAGDPAAQYRLGELYEQGQGVIPQPCRRRCACSAPPASRAMSPPRRKLGDIYLSGRGAPASVTPAAMALHEEAGAEGGSGGRASLIGRLFPDGLLVRQDVAEAARWNERAASAGDAGAASRLGYQYAAGLGVDQDFEAARRWYTAAAETGHEDGILGLGILLAGGYGGTPDQAAARPWFERAAEMGNSSARFFLGVFYLNGEGVDRDEARAVQFFRQAAEADHPGAMYYLGELLRRGTGAPADELEAETWLRRAATRGNLRALVALGHMLTLTRATGPGETRPAQRPRLPLRRCSLSRGGRAGRSRGPAGAGRPLSRRPGRAAGSGRGGALAAEGGGSGPGLRL